MPRYPVLPAAHDALLEDLLENAERAAGGSPAPPPPLPRMLRVANAVEGGLIRLRRNPLGSIVPGTLGGDRRPARGLGARLALAGRE
jgi:hypothetical protein